MRLEVRSQEALVTVVANCILFVFLETKNKVSAEFITKFIHDYIPTAQLICETSYELSYILPDKGKERKGMLKKLFENLERSKNKLQCESFGLQDTTLEEVQILIPFLTHFNSFLSLC